MNRLACIIYPLFLAILLGCGGSGGGTPSAFLTSIAVSPADRSVTVGTSQQFTATGTYSDSSTRDLTASVSWASSDGAIATVDSTGLVTPVAAGTTTITATSGSMSGNTSLEIRPSAISLQRTINITMDLHCDPLDQKATIEARRTIFRRQLANASWLLDFLEPYGGKVSFLAVGECYEFCVEESEQAICLPLLRRLQASGGILGTHQHREYYRGVHNWPITPITDEADIRKVWDSGKQFTDMAVRMAMGLTDPAAIAAVNTAAESHAQLSDPNQLMEEYGYTIREGGADQIMTGYFSHVPWNPFRPGQTAISEDLTTKFVTVPQGMIIGQVGEHVGIWQDGTSARKKAEFLQLYANWKERSRTGAAPKVWSFGWGVHTQDLDVGSASRAAIADLVPWLWNEFVVKADDTGKAPARFASYIDVRDEYHTWEAEHPGVSSFSYAAKATDYARYPYLVWANRYLRFARFDSRIVAPGADVFLMRAGDYSVTKPTTYPFVLARAKSSPASVDLSSTFGAGTLQCIKLSDGSSTVIPAAAVSLSSEPVVLCAAADCDAILALESASSGAACGSSVCKAGQVCATDAIPNVCVPDCRIHGNICPAARPTCDQATGVCR